MKEIFFMFVGGGIVFAILGFGLWKVILAFHLLYTDWQLGREVDQLEAERAEQAREQQSANAERLSNGCEHRFEWSGGCEPRRVCCNCGLEAQRPAENCDHVWKRGNEAVPRAYCAKCGKELAGTAVGVTQA